MKSLKIFVIVQLLIGPIIGNSVINAQEEVANSVQSVPEYTLEPAQTSVVFAISHFKLSYTYGRFNKVRGKFAFDPKRVEKSRFEFEIEADSIDTNLKERDDHLKGPDFFDAQQFPKIRLTSETVVSTEDGLLMKGWLTVRGESRRVEIPLRVVGIGKGPFGKDRAGFFAKFTIKRSDFGMEKMLPDIGDNVAITFSFEGLKNQPSDKEQD